MKIKSLIGITLLLLPISLHAFQFQITGRKFIPANQITQQYIYVTNTSSKIIAVEATMHNRKINIDGVETRSLNEDDFIIFPNQMLILPKQQQVVTIQWIGQQPTVEMPYRLILEQLPIKTPTIAQTQQKVAAINMYQQYIKSIFVQPPNPAPKIKLKSVTATKKESPRLTVVLKNDGNGHLNFHQVTFQLEPQVDGAFPPQSIQYVANDLNEVIVLLPNSERRIHFPWPKSIPFTKVNATLNAID